MWEGRSEITQAVSYLGLVSYLGFLKEGNLGGEGQPYSLSIWFASSYVT